MKVELILNIAYMSLMFLAGFIPGLIGFIKAAKTKKKAKTAAEIEAANKDMQDQAEKLISSAETFYKSLDVMLKSNGESAGPFKKESVMNKLQAYATEKGYTFDIEYWSSKIDSIVKLTKEVNAK